MITKVFDYNYAGIPNDKPVNTKCIVISIADDFGNFGEISIDDEMWQKQIEINEKILFYLITDKEKELFYLKFQTNVGEFNSIQKYKGLWWKGKKGEKCFANQSKEIIINQDEHYVMAAYTNVQSNEIHNILNYSDVFCFSDNETIQNLFKNNQSILLDKKHIIEYLLASNGIIICFRDEGYEGVYLFMYCNESVDIGKLKKDINQMLNK